MLEWMGSSLTCDAPVLMAILVVLTLPETSAPNRKPSAEVETRHTDNESFAKHAKMANKILVQPFALLAYLRFPPVASTVYLHSVSFGSLYFMNISLQQTFVLPPYEFSAWPVGFVFAPAFVGFLVAGVVGGRWMDKIMHRRAVKQNRVDSDGRLVYLPEDRLRENAWLALVLYPGMMMWYGWTAHFRLHWALVVRLPPRYCDVVSC